MSVTMWRRRSEVKTQGPCPARGEGSSPFRPNKICRLLANNLASTLSLPKILCSPRGMSFPSRTAKRKQCAALPESGEQKAPMHTCAWKQNWDTQISKGPGEKARSVVDSGFFRQPVVRSGDAGHRPAERPRRTPFPAAESLVARASPSPMKDVFSIDDSNRNTN